MKKAHVGPVTPIKDPAIANRVTLLQKELIVNFMENHPNLVNSKNNRNDPNGEFVRLWSELTNILNASGDNVTKNAEKWRKTWSDMKRDVKEKAARIREQHKLLIPINGVEEKLSPLQDRLLALLNKVEEGIEDDPPPELEYIGPEQVAAFQTKCAEEIAGFGLDLKSDIVIKQEFSPETEVEESSTQQESTYPSQEQNGPTTPPSKKPRTTFQAEAPTPVTEATPSEKLCGKHTVYAVLAEQQAATASALRRLANVAEHRLAIEKRKAAAMERFVELFFKQQRTN